ncbi:Imm42 family immunity protein [Stenoxybacter acetivorans]|uniref:Imm42 family immunity protein n=1 Tax=Stenoxybacter acetivorans TaxID=422441 RepID=UPI00055A4004|nr:Imm42 family immunity protein [Stenoxybacter acetivorans]
MIFGDPYDFALQFQIVENWNNENNFWKNGMFYFYLNGEAIFNKVCVSELRSVYATYFDINLIQVPKNDINISALELFQNADNHFFKTGEDLISGILDLTCTTMRDNGYDIYFLGTSSGDRFVWSSDSGKTINEIFFKKEIFFNTISKMPADFIR